MKRLDYRHLGNSLWLEISAILIGSLLIAASLLADLVGAGGQGGFGSRQAILLAIGSGLLLAAIIDLIARRLGWDPGIPTLAEIKTRSIEPGTAASVVGLHIPALDGIRGLAIVLVVVHHLALSLMTEFSYDTSLLRFAVFGWIGVDLFFVLSGFLITGILYDSKASGHYFKNFYIRRALRIFPLYYGTQLLVLLLRAVWPEAGIYGSAKPAWMWVYLTNIVIAWKGWRAFGFMDHFWALAIQMHFYLVWPLVVFSFNRRRLMQFSVVLFLISLGLRIALVFLGTRSEALCTLTPLRLDALSIGAALALAVRHPEGLRRLAKWVWLAGGASGLTIIAIVVMRHTTYHDDPVMQTLGYSLLAVFFGVLLKLSLTSPLRHVFNSAVLRWLGKYSYGIFVWHPIIMFIVFHSDAARKIRGGSGTVEMIVSVVLVLVVLFAVTLLSWHCWESQFLKLKRYFG